MEIFVKMHLWKTLSTEFSHILSRNQCQPEVPVTTISSCLRDYANLKRDLTYTSSSVFTSITNTFTHLTGVPFVALVVNVKTEWTLCYSACMPRVHLICMLNRISQNMWMHVPHRLRAGAERFPVTALQWCLERRLSEKEAWVKRTALQQMPSS